MKKLILTSFTLGHSLITALSIVAYQDRNYVNFAIHKTNTSWINVAAWECSHYASVKEVNHIPPLPSNANGFVSSDVKQGLIFASVT